MSEASREHIDSEMGKMTGDFIGSSFLVHIGDSVEFVVDHFRPEQAYHPEVLAGWAEENGWVRGGEQ